MVSRIATSYQNQVTLRQLQENLSSVNKTSLQVTTGYKSTTLSGYSSEANELLDLYDLQGKTSMYKNNIQTAENRLKATESSLQGMLDLLSEAASLWTLGRNENSATTRNSLAPKAESLANSFYDLLKTDFDGRYIFSGQNGADTPTDATATATAYASAPASTTWYTGDSSQSSIITGPNQTTSYGVVGNESAMQNMKAGLEALWYGLENNSVTDIDSAIGALESAQSQLSGLLGNVGGQLSSLELMSTRHENATVFLQEQVDKLDKVDVTEAITQFSQQQAALEASMMVITQINRLSLLDFI